MTADLVQFLRDRFDEDEQTAHIGDASEPPLTFRQIGDTGVIVASDGTHAEECANGNWAGIAEHIARHDPARVLAEVDAKQQIVALHSATPDRHSLTGFVCRICNDGGLPVEPATWPCATLRLLALPYVSHPDSRPEWARTV